MMMDYYFSSQCVIGILNTQQTDRETDEKQTAMGHWKHAPQAEEKVI